MVDDLSGGALHPRGTTRGAAVIILMPVLERRCAHFPEGADLRNVELDEIERKGREEGATCRPGWAPG